MADRGLMDRLVQGWKVGIAERDAFVCAGSLIIVLQIALTGFGTYHQAQTKRIAEQKAAAERARYAQEYALKEQAERRRQAEEAQLARARDQMKRKEAAEQQARMAREKEKQDMARRADAEAARRAEADAARRADMARREQADSARRAEDARRAQASAAKFEQERLVKGLEACKQFSGPRKTLCEERAHQFYRCANKRGTPGCP